jgi:Zn finger protein HypA/HybF involved in hydrogenase expression
MGTKTSPIYRATLEEFRIAIDSSETIEQVLEKLGSRMGGGNHRTLYKRCEEEGISLDELRQRGREKRIRLSTQLTIWQTIPLEDILVEGSLYDRGRLKKRLLKERILENRCSECGLDPVWNGKQISFVIDHINGVRDDNRIGNLRILCPNCNSQTPTFSGRQNKKDHKCQDCGAEVTRKSKWCLSCSSKRKPRKVGNRPSADELRSMMQEMTQVEIGKMYGVSATSIRKWAGVYGLKKKQNDASEV